MARIQIYVTEELKRRMDAVGEEGRWSLVAREAFDKELQRIESERSLRDFRAAVKRVRNSATHSKPEHFDLMQRFPTWNPPA